MSLHGCYFSIPEATRVRDLCYAEVILLLRTGCGRLTWLGFAPEYRRRLPQRAKWISGAQEHKAAMRSKSECTKKLVALA
jgi:hypothetical protein